MPQQTHNFLMSLGFCQWYNASNSCLPEFKINGFGLKLILARQKQKVFEHKQVKRVQVAGFGEYEAEVGSEASDAESS